MKVVILAGGYSTRLPHKLFLTTENSRPLFTEALVTAVYAGCVDITYAVNTELEAAMRRLLSPVVLDEYSKAPKQGRKWIEALDVKWYVDNHAGLDAIINHFCAEGPTAFMCADNLYSVETANLLRRADHLIEDGPLATVNPLAGNDNQLDGWTIDAQQWTYRAHPYDHALTTPWLFPRDFKAVDGLLPTLNTNKVKPVEVFDPQWCDLGTVEKVKRYYENLED